MFESANVVRIASRLAGWATHRYQPGTSNSPARCWYHSPLCCLWHSHSTLSVVQERAGTGRWDRRHTTGKHRLLTYLDPDNQCLYCHWWIDYSIQKLWVMYPYQQRCLTSKSTKSITSRCETGQTDRQTDRLTTSFMSLQQLVNIKMNIKKNEWWLLQIDGATEEHAGSYLCSVSNVLEERWTEAVEVNISMSSLLSSSEIYKWNHENGAKKGKKKNIFPLYSFYSTC